MDKKTKVKIIFDSDAAKKSLDALKKGLDGLKTIGTKALQGVGKIGSAAFKSIGVALKGAGIGILISSLAALWEAIKKNQKIMDLFEKAINFIGIAIKPLVDGISSLVEKFSANKELMEKTKKVIIDLLNIALTPLKLSFYSIKLGVQEAMLAWEKSMFGGKDADKIKQLNADIQETKDNIKEVAIAAVDSAKDFANNIGDVVKGVANIVTQVVKETKEAYSKLSFDIINAQAAAMVQAQKDLERLAKEQEKIVKIAETAAEKQRQQRDDETKSFEERLKANQDLAAILEKQRLDEEGNINKRINAQKILNSLDIENEEGKNALYDLNNQLLDLESRITGQLSEQKTNAVALAKEQAAAKENLLKIEKDAAAELEKFHANQIINTNEKISKLKELEKAEYESNKEILENKISGLEEYSTLWYEAKQQEIELEKAHNLSVAQFAVDQLANDKDILAKKKDLYKQSAQNLLAIDKELTNTKLNLLENQLTKGQISQEQYDKKVEKIQENAAKRQKVMAIAQVINDTAASIMGIWRDFPKVDYGIAATVGSIAVGALGLAQIANIASGKIGGSAKSAVPSGSGGGGSEGTTPNTSFTFSKGYDQPQPKPIQTFVVAKQVTTQQQLDREIVNNGTV